jgi:hypothetical protein
MLIFPDRRAIINALRARRDIVARDDRPVRWRQPMIIDDEDAKWDFGDGRQPVDPGKPVLRFRIELPLYDDNVEQPRRTVTRLIEVPANYSFWDLHVAIQSAMGWCDSHLHEFVIPETKKKSAIKLGLATDDIPEDVADDRTVLILTHLARIRAGNGMLYTYDFGDNWKHWVVYEATLASDGGLYPRCLAGQWACPPEDVGGDGGYFAMLEVLAGPKDNEYKEQREWLRAALGPRGSWPYHPERFDPTKVKFDDPAVREEYVFHGPH